MMGIIIGTCVPDAEQDTAAYGAQMRRPPRRILYGKYLTDDVVV